MRYVRDSKEECYGCSACMHKCPEQAIQMLPDSEGFFYPAIDKSLCTDCGLCIKICDSHHKIAKKNSRTPDGYFGWAKSEELRFHSSSGGFFTLFAEDVLNAGGVVFGAAFNSNNEVMHICVSTPKELARLRGAKYVQSRIGACYLEVKKFLDSGKKVLFSGTPCQVSGLYAFLGKNLKNLLTVDIVCAGASSPKVFQKYLNQLAPTIQEPVAINFRDKTWGEQGITISVRNDSSLIAVEKRNESKYTEGFLEALFNRPACADCVFAKPSRVGDITLGDFWGAHDYKPALDSRKGLSLLLANTPKGRAWMGRVKSGMAHCEPVPLPYAKRNSRLSGPKASHPGRHYFFTHLDEADSFTSLVDDSLSRVHRHVGILNFCYGNGYGQVLMNYALHKVLQGFGYTSEVINYSPSHNDANVLTYEEFREAFLHRTNHVVATRALEPLNKRFGIFLAGSDQVFRYHRNFTNMFYWVHGEKLLTAYAASFGIDDFVGSKQEGEIVSDLLGRFDAISVREASGVAICNKLGVTATHVLDPTLLLDAEDYQPIIDSEQGKKPKGSYIAYFFLDEGRKAAFEQSKLAKELSVQHQLINLRENHSTAPLSVPRWLLLLKHTDCVFTDSYHCLLFSIILQRSFLVLARDLGGNERILSLFGQLHIPQDRFQSDFSFDFQKIIDNALDYKKINQKTLELRKDSLDFLKNALASPVSYKAKTKYPYFDESPQNSMEVNILTELKTAHEEVRILSEENIKLKALIQLLNQKIERLKN